MGISYSVIVFQFVPISIPTFDNTSLSVPNLTLLVLNVDATWGEVALGRVSRLISRDHVSGDPIQLRQPM